jgi:glutamyl-Q tRNA(Asp) synthetase
MRPSTSPTWCAAKTWPTTHPRQILLQQALGVPTPSYLHTPLVLWRQRRKALQTERRHSAGSSDPLQALGNAARVLGLPLHVEQIHKNHAT